jgi:hypothetical protein
MPLFCIASFQSAAALSHSALVTMQLANGPDPFRSPWYRAHFSEGEEAGKIGPMSYVFPPPPQAVSAAAMPATANRAEILVIIGISLSSLRVMGRFGSR